MVGIPHTYVKFSVSLAGRYYAKTYREYAVTSSIMRLNIGAEVTLP
jgi:hypothetical protein